MKTPTSIRLRHGLATITALVLVGVLFAIWTALGSDGPKDEEEGRMPQPPPYERERASKVPRPEESQAMPLAAAKAAMGRNEDLSKIVAAAESGNVETLIELAKKTDDYCGIYRVVPEGCTSRDDKVTAVFFDGGTIYPKPAAQMATWLRQISRTIPLG